MWTGWAPASYFVLCSCFVQFCFFPDDPVPDPDLVPVPGTGSEDDGDMSSVSSDHPDLPAPDPVPDPPAPDSVPVPSYPSITVADIPGRPRTKYMKRPTVQPTAFPFSSPKVPLIPKSKAVSFHK